MIPSLRVCCGQLRLCSVVALGVVLGLGGAPAPTHAASAGDRVGLLDAQYGADLPQSVQDLLGRTLLEEFSSGEFRLVPVDRGECASDDCIPTLAEESNVRIVIDPVIGYANRNYDLSISVRNATGEVLSDYQETCTVCGRQEAAETLAALCARATKTIADRIGKPGLIVVVTSPAGADVSIDGQRVGRSPIEHEAAPGPHQIAVTATGYADRERDITVQGGGREVFQFEMDKPTRSARPLIIAGWASLGVGTISTVGGITLLALHDRPFQSRCSGTDVDINGTCRFRHDTLIGGAVATAAGLLVTGAAVALLVYGYRKKRRRR